MPVYIYLYMVDDLPGANIVIICHDPRTGNLLFADCMYFGGKGCICALSCLPEEWIRAKER